MRNTDTEIDFLRADLLYQILIADRSVVIEPFTISAKLSPLKSLIETLYQFKELDSQMLSELEYASMIFESIEDENLNSMATKYMAFIAGGDDDLLNIAVKASNVKSIILKKTISVPSTHPSLVFYNKKTNQIANGTSINSDGIAWCQNIIDMVKEGSLEDAVSYLKNIRQVIQKLFELTSDFSLNHYIALLSPYSARDQRIIRKLCENMFLIDLSTIAPESLGQDLMDEIPISPHDLPHEEDQDMIDEIQRNEGDIFQLASEIPERFEPEIEEQKEKEEDSPIQANDPHIMEFQHFVMNSPEYAAVFEIAIDDARKQFQMLAATPEMTYTLLRKKQWATAIPSSFFITMLRFILVDLVTRNQIGNFVEVVKKEGQKLHDACEGLPGLPTVLGNLNEIHQFEQDAEIAPKLQKHNVAVLPVLPEKKKSLVSHSTNSISSIRPLNTSGDTPTMNISKDRVNLQLTHLTKELIKIPKSERLIFFSNKLKTIKQKLSM